MEREAMHGLLEWGRSPHRKPLMVRGARQVGKTWLVNEYGHQNYDAVAHIVFLQNPTMRAVFGTASDPDALLQAIGAYTGTDAGSGRVLVFLDEIQECPEAIAALKLFCEKRPDVPVVAAGSLLGVALRDRSGEGVSWPVGKVEYLDMHPLTFFEFLAATGHRQYVDLIRQGAFDILNPLGDELERLLRSYCYVGGMPEAVQWFVDSGDYARARKVQDRLLLDYEHDFSKHVRTPMETEHIRQVWRSVPRQLAREDGAKKFTFAQVVDGGRGRDYRDPVTWLADTGLVTKVSRVSKPGVPLSACAQEKAFKLFMLDVGLLGAASGLDTRTLVEGNRLFTEFKGALAEQYVCQQMVASNTCVPYYWSSDKAGSRAKIDFLYEHEGQITPIEVKAQENVRGVSIRTFSQENGIGKALRFSMRGMVDQGWLANYPLWAAGLLPISAPQNYVRTSNG